MSEARAVVLGRIRTALGPAPVVPPVSRGYRRAGEHPPGSPALLELLAERLADYRAEVHRMAPADLPVALPALLAALVGGGRLVAPGGLPPGWTGVDVRRDDGSTTTAELDTAAGVVTGCAVAVAETGTLVLDSGPHSGRRAITLVPDLHVCVVLAEQVVQTVPEALARLDPRRPQTWVSGPSATSDIELQRVEGVHGPRTLHAVIVG